MDTFFVIVARWAGVRDEEDEESIDEDTGLLHRSGQDITRRMTGSPCSSGEDAHTHEMVDLDGGLVGMTISRPCIILPG